MYLFQYLTPGSVWMVLYTPKEVISDILNVVVSELGAHPYMSNKTIQFRRTLNKFNLFYRCGAKPFLKGLGVSAHPPVSGVLPLLITVD